MNVAEAREVIQAGNVAWGNARVGYDRETFERMLAPDFFVRLHDRTLTRQEFIDLISGRSPDTRLVRFDASVLTVQAEDDFWVAIILERLESVSRATDGSTTSRRLLAVTRDGWKQEGDRWSILFTELLGNEGWPEGVVPPVREW